MKAHPKTTTQPWRVDAPLALTTKELGALLRVKPETIRSGYCKTGNYLGLRPLKLSNRLLRWSAADVERLLGDAAGPCEEGAQILPSRRR